MIVLLPFAYLAGVVTVLSPCILPILPIVLASAFGNSRWRPLGIVLGLVLSFSFFTLTLSALVSLLGISADALRLGGAVAIGLFGVVMVVPALNRRFEGLTTRLSGFGRIFPVGADFWGGALVGASLGLVWAPCAGPILASVTTLVATSRISWEAVAVTLAYTTGAGTPMLLIAYGGRRIISRVHWLSRHAVGLQRAFGVVMIAFALTFFAGADRAVQTALVQSVPPEWTNALTSFEQVPVVREALDAFSGRDAEAPPAAPPADAANPGPGAGLPNLGPAPELAGITDWLNGEQVTLASLRGRVVLVDFWTYSCINCIRTLPYLNDWQAKYADAGLVILGIHTPEFAFERPRENVARAVGQYGIEYRVALDNDYATWTAFDNLYWPAKYLIDAEGRVRYRHFGEGEYEETDAAIRSLLAEAGAVADEGSEMDEYSLTRGRTPELYLGATRQSYLASPEPYTVGRPQFFSAPPILQRHQFAFVGEWTVGEEYARAESGGQLDLQFYADDVYVVLTPAEGGGVVEVLLDGQPIAGNLAGADVHEGAVMVGEPRAYHLVDLRAAPGEHRLSLRFLDGGEGAYAFTFG